MTLCIGEHLDLDVAAHFHEALEQDALVAEGLQGFAPRTGECLGEIGQRPHDAHALAAAASGRLDQQREAQARGLGDQPLRRLVGVVVAGQDRHPRCRHQAPRLAFRSHPQDRLGRRTDEDHARVAASLREAGVLGQKSVAGMDRRGPRFARELENSGSVQVALAGRRGPHAVRLVRESYVQGITVGFRVDGDGAQAEPAGRPDDAAGNLATIRNQQAVDHGGPHMRKMP